jgi:hypothetical protein
MGGLGLFTFAGLVREASITSLLARLNDPSFVGAASRTRWHHMQELLTHSPSPIVPRADSFTLHCVQSAARLGYTIYQNKPTPELPDSNPSLHPEDPHTIDNLRHTVSTDILLS